jgi:hypothetical protein
MEYDIEFGGGLGDIFYQMCVEGGYRLLDRLGPQDRARVILISHNPFASELFRWHPHAPQIEVRDLGYWLPQDDARMRLEHGLPYRRSSYPVAATPVVFHPSPEDLAVLGELGSERCVVFAASAGLPDRDLPVEIVERLAALSGAAGLLPVFTGRNYERHGRREYRPPQGVGCDLVDRLSVPGVARLLEQAVGLVSCHSALNLLGWLMRKPQLLLYPPSVEERHIARRDQWAFGIDFPECRHATIGDPRIEALADSFFADLSRTPLPVAHGSPSRRLEGRRNPAETVPMPAGCLTIELDEATPRLTSAKEVKFLCWLAHQTDGNIVEIGCNKGLTTRDLARTNPGKLVYAVDYFASRSRLNDRQRGERPSPDEFCVHARELENVVVLHAESARLNYGALRGVKLVFIDGDHTFDGVRADTEQARRHLELNGGGFLVWHDYYDGAPEWVGVKRYVDSLDLAVEHVAGTWLAMARVDGAAAQERG